MKEKKQIHTGLCITDDRIVATTAHIENKTMIITDAMEMKRSSTIDEDIAEFINTYDLEEGEYSIVACIPTEMTMASFDPHDFDVKESVDREISLLSSHVNQVFSPLRINTPTSFGMIFRTNSITVLFKLKLPEEFRILRKVIPLFVGQMCSRRAGEFLSATSKLPEFTSYKFVKRGKSSSR